MSAVAYYNEIDPFAAQWLRNLVAAGLIAPGEVDDRSIEEVQPDDLKPYTQCHFFAGIGVWSYALRLAGWPDDRPVWTGSCPCQPFSAAGKRAGDADPRHLWPSFRRLIAQCHPATVFGEQVASKDGREWLDVVSADLEALGFAVGAADLCAAGVSAPHIRQRLWFVAHSGSNRRQRRVCRRADTQRQALDGQAGRGSAVGRVADSTSLRRDQSGQTASAEAEERRQARPGYAGQLPGRTKGLGGVGAAGALHGFWRDADWLYCRDDKWRPVEPGIAPLVDGVAGRVGQLRAYGNAIVAPLAQVFIEAAMECLP